MLDPQAGGSRPPIRNLGPRYPNDMLERASYQLNDKTVEQISNIYSNQGSKIGQNDV